MTTNDTLVTSKTIYELMGAKRDPLTTVIPMTILYALILVTGVVGNVSTCLVIVRNRHMKTATNYYLFSLAISDLLLLILGLPQELYTLWQKYPYVFGESFCLLRGLTSETSTNASVLTITAFTIERYLAICHPLKAHTMSKLSRVIKLVIAIWILAALSAIPIAMQFGIKYQKINDEIHEETAECTIKNLISYTFEISTFIFFAIPFTVICFLYLLIGIQLRRSEVMNRSEQVSSSAANGHILKSVNVDTQQDGSVKKQKKGSIFGKGNTMYSKIRTRRSYRSQFGGASVRGNANTASRRAVIKMLVAVVVAFFVCWTPFHAQRLLATYMMSYNTPEENPPKILISCYGVLLHISGVTYFISATINPILYSIMSLKFRQAFKDTLGQCCGRSPEAPKFGKFGSGSSAMSRFTSTIRSTTGSEGSNGGSRKLSGKSIQYRSNSIEQDLIAVNEINESSYNNNNKRNSTFSSTSLDPIMEEKRNQSVALSNIIMHITTVPA